MKRYLLHLPKGLRFFLEHEGDPFKNPSKHPEYYFLDAKAMEFVHWRHKVITTGSLSLVKAFYDRITYSDARIFQEMTRVGLDEEGYGDEWKYDFEDLREAVYAGNKKIFWYLLHLFNMDDVENKPAVFIDVIHPMISYGRLDWIQEYRRRYPEDFHESMKDFRSELIESALLEQEIPIIRYLVSLGMNIDGYHVEFVIGTMIDKLEAHPYREYDEVDIETELDHMRSSLLPILRNLRAKYPDRVNSYAITGLLREHKEVDEVGEMVDSEEDT